MNVRMIVGLKNIKNGFFADFFFILNKNKEVNSQIEMFKKFSYQFLLSLSRLSCLLKDEVFLETKYFGCLDLNQLSKSST